MKGIILAAGRGTRLRPWTDDKPKPLLNMAGQPILNYILDGFAAAGVEDLFIVVGYLGDAMRNYYGSEYSGMRLSWLEQKELLGTGHALMLAEKELSGSDFMLGFGDVLVDHENYPALSEFHNRGGFDASITLNEVEDPYAGAAVYVDGDIVTKLIEKPPRGESTTRWNNRGLFIFTPDIFDEVRRLKKSPRGEYELPTAVNMLVENGKRVGAMPVTGFTSDVGTKEEFEEYESYIIKKRGVR
jgi:NDP-sugar pyrophosphorylase family protein